MSILIGNLMQTVYNVVNKIIIIIIVDMFEYQVYFIFFFVARYVILENLRYMLLPVNHTTPIYFGLRFKKFVKQGYMSGGAGYVLSKEAVRRFVDVSILLNII